MAKELEVKIGGVWLIADYTHLFELTNQIEAVKINGRRYELNIAKSQMTAFVARDKNQDIYLYRAKPRECKSDFVPSVFNDGLKLCRDAFPTVCPMEQRTVIISLGEETNIEKFKWLSDE
jgi:hypothetical protein